MLVDAYFRGSSSPPSTSNPYVRWYAPHPGFVKIKSSVAGIFILRDWMGKSIKGAAYYEETSILVAEVRSFRDEVNLAVQVEFDKIVIESDNQIVIQSLKGNIQIPW